MSVKKYIPLAPVIVAVSVMLCGAFLIARAIDAGLSCFPVSRETPCEFDVAEFLR